MNNRKILLVFGAFLLAIALSLIVRLLDNRKESAHYNSRDADSASDR